MIKATAQAGVRQYVGVNLRNRTAEVYQDPDGDVGRYSTTRVVGGNEPLVLRVGDGEYLSVRLSASLP